MKEAAGEANLTVVAIILIGAIVAVATPIIKSTINNSKNRACRVDAGYYQDDSGNWVGGNETDYKNCLNS